MSGERLLLRRLIPLLAALILLAPVTAQAAGPDPAPGSKPKVLKPDPAPSAASTPKPKVTTTVRRTLPAQVVRPGVVPLVHTTPVVKQHTPAVHRAKPKVAAGPKPRSKPALVVPALPRVLVPRFIAAPLSS